MTTHHCIITCLSARILALCFLPISLDLAACNAHHSKIRVQFALFTTRDVRSVTATLTKARYFHVPSAIMVIIWVSSLLSNENRFIHVQARLPCGLKIFLRIHPTMAQSWVDQKWPIYICSGGKLHVFWFGRRVLCQRTDFRTYRIYLIVALVISVLLLGITVVLAILLYQKIHHLDQVVSSTVSSTETSHNWSSCFLTFRRTNSISVENKWAQPKML